MELQTAQIIGLTLAGLMTIIGACLLWLGLIPRNHKEN